MQIFIKYFLLKFIIALSILVNHNCIKYQTNMNKINLVGQKFGKLTIISASSSVLLGIKNPKKVGRWLCKCDCGQKKIATTTALKAGDVGSCGCVKGLINQAFGKLTVISKAPTIIRDGRKFGAWNCDCSCGKTSIVRTECLKNGTVTSCGCSVKMFKAELAIGQKFNRLTVVAKSSDIKYKQTVWECLCDCGNLKDVITRELMSGRIKSCGCFKAEKSKINGLLGADKVRKYSPVEASARRIWNNYKSDISFEDFMTVTQLPCHYCGVEPSNVCDYRFSDMKKEAATFTYSGLDRIDSTNPKHSIENIFSCCWTCNRSKSNMAYNEFSTYQDRIAKFWNDKD